MALGLGQMIPNVVIRCHDPRGCKPAVRQLMVPLSESQQQWQKIYQQHYE